MGFCHTCQALPIRSFLKLHQCDSSVYDEFQWFRLPRSVTTEETKEPFYRWHNSVSDLQNSGSTCAFCEAIFSHLSGSYHYQMNCKDRDGTALWILAPIGSPMLKVFMGLAEPQIQLSGNFSYTTTPDSSVAGCFKSHVPIQDQLRPFVLRQMAAWVTNCDENHADCSTSVPARNASQLPTRLLDLGSMPKAADFEGAPGDPRTLLENTSLRLIEKGPDSQGQYIALSYCWGKALAFTTTSKTLNKYKENGGIKYSQLPETIRDAVFLTRYLGIRYLWADCLCIIQDNGADWEREASRMADVYSNAYLTIAATRASHCGEGFLHARKLRGETIICFEDDKGSFDLFFRYDDLMWSPGSMESITDESITMRRVQLTFLMIRTAFRQANVNKEEPLLSRGWVLQERILATRTLQFTSYNMRLECSKQVFTEPQFVDEYGTSKETSLERIAKGLESIKNAAPITGTQEIQVPVVNGRSYGWRVWARMIEDYTSRNLSFASDKFPALGGVISALQELTGDTCFAGIWKSWFLQGLLWRLQDPNWDEYVFFPKEPQRAVPWRAPTWSFASVEGVVLYLLLEENFDQGLCAELLSCEVTPKGKNPLGELTDGFAKIRGPIAAVSAVLPDLSLNGRECMVSMTNGRLAEASIYFDIDVYDPCQVIMITPHMGVAIIPIGVTEGRYTRVGVVWVYRVFDPGSDTRSRGKRAHENLDRSISSSHYPSPETITLL